MKKKINHYLSLLLWIAGLLIVGSVIGSLTKKDVSTWYTYLYRSPLTPPNYVFGIAWTILYILIAICGWAIWHYSKSLEYTCLKKMYLLQLILNWSWTPLFFTYHLTGLSLLCLLLLDSIVAAIMYVAYFKIRWVTLLMTPYLAWLLFATYLNTYIFIHN